MKKIFASILLLAMSISMAAANVDNTNNTKGKPKTATKAPAAKEQSFDGWISDEKCGAKIDADCAKKCQAAGIRMVFVDTDKNVIPVENPEMLKDLAGQHVTIKGKMDKGSLKVESAKATPEAGK
jgi:hypothetical protein